MNVPQMTKEECLRIGWFSELYFVDGFNSKGDYCWIDRETGETVAIICTKEEQGENFRT